MVLPSKPGGDESRMAAEEAGQADTTPDRSMRALLLDEEAGGVGQGDRPLRLQREGGAEIDAAAPPRSAGAEKSATPAGKGASASGAAPARSGAPSAGGASTGGTSTRAPAPGSRGVPVAAGAERVVAAVIPGLGQVQGGHVGATVGLLNGAATHRVPGDAKHQQLAAWAQQDPARYAADFLLYGHNRKRYEELARAGRLPSQVWAEYEATGQLDRQLRTVHERYGERLRQLYRERPLGERSILGLAAVTGSAEDVARALDALRVHHHYPARVSFARLVRGFSSPEIARIGAAFLPGHGGSAVEVYRAIQEARERALIERRRRLLRKLRELWAAEHPAIVPLFEVITRGFSPMQVELLRRELERSGDVDAVFDQIELENLRHRLDAVEAAFQRWFSEWEASRDPSVQTPVQDPNLVLNVLVPPRKSDMSPGSAEPSNAVDDGPPDSQRRLALQRTLGDVDVPEDEEQGLDDAGAPQALRAPPPGAHAADGVMPWHILAQGLGRAAEERLLRAWEEGRQWDVYREILSARGEALRVAREAAFRQRLEGLSSPLPGPSGIDREQLAALAPLCAGFTPEQWARLLAALTEGTADPLEVWREIERENLAEAMSVREPAFLRYMGAWGHAPRWNPPEWSRTAPQLGRVLLDEEAAGMFDDLQNALGSEAGREVLSAMGKGLGALFGGAPGGGQGGIDALGGKLRGFAEQALGALTGRRTPTRPNAGGEEAGAPAGVAAPGEVLSAIDKSLGGLAVQAVGALSGQAAPSSPGAAPAGAFDVQSVLAQWVGPQKQIGERVVRGLAGIGLHDVAAMPPKELLNVLAGHAPTSADLSGWWHELTTGQGLSEGAEGLLRRTIDADGPDGIGHTIATYVRLLEDATSAQKAQREALFTKILAAAQRTAGPSFDPASLPGGDPFLILSRHAGGGWQRVVDAMKREDNPLAAFRQIEDERLRRLLHVDAPEWMAGMLSALWEQREGVGWAPGGDVGAPEDAGASEDAGLPEDAGAPGPRAGAPGPRAGAPGPQQGRPQPGGPQPGGPPSGGRERPQERPQPDRERPRDPGRVVREPYREPGHVVHEPYREHGRVVVREPYREHGRVVVREPYREVFRRPIHGYNPFYELPWWRRPVGRPVWGPFRESVPGPQREVFWRDPYDPIERRPFMRYWRPRPLYHLSFGRPMSQGELRRLLLFVPQLRAHPYGVLAEMAGLVGQARDVRGVDATTGEYLLLPGETLMDVAFKLVGERRRWRELLVANPLRAEGDPRVRIPPSWFGYVPYSIPLHRVRELIALRGGAETGDPEDAGDVEAAGDEAGDLEAAGDEAGDGAGDVEAAGDEAGDIEAAGDEAAGDEAGYWAWRPGAARPRFVRPGFVRGGWRRRGHWPRWWRAPGRGFGPMAFEEDLIGEYPESANPSDAEASGAGDASPRPYTVTRYDARGPLSPRYTREVAETIAIQHGLWDGYRWQRPYWWSELREVNPQKPLNPDGWWRDVSEGEVLWIPGFWPRAMPEPSPEASGPGDLWDEIAEDSPLPAGSGGQRGQHPNLTRQTYKVLRGDWPQRIARKFGAERRRHWLNELLRANPHKPVDSGLGNWFTLDIGEVINIPDAWMGADTGEPEDTDAGIPRQNITTRTYAVVAGEGMQRIAQKLGAAMRPHWFGELRDANPHKKMRTEKGKQIQWEQLDPGEIINIPDAWPDSPLLRPPPGGTPTPAPYPGLTQFPTFPGGAVPSPTAPPGTVPAAATVDPGTILRVQAILIAFRHVHPEAIVPKDFGAGMPFSPDATGVLTPRTQQALASFQRWSNASTGSRLRTDGVLDPDTIAALDSFSAQAVGGMAQRPPVTPIAGATPARGDGAPGGPPQPSPAPSAPPAGREATDPFAGLFQAAGDFLRTVQPGAPPAPRAPAPDPSAPPPRRPPPPRVPLPPPPPEPVLNELPDALEQYGIPGVPGLPGGAPHAPKPRRPRVDVPAPPAPDVSPEPPPEPPAPAPAAKKGDDAVVPVVLAGLGILSGVLV